MSSEANPITSTPFSMEFDPQTGGYLLKVLTSGVESETDELVSVSGSHAASQNLTLINPGYIGAYIFWDITGQPSTGTIQLFVDAKNPATADWTAIYQSSSFNASGTVTTLKKYLMRPGAVDTGSQLTGVCQLPLPHNWRIRILNTPSNASWVYSLGVAYIE